MLAAAPAVATAPPLLAALAGLGVLVATWGALAMRKPNLVAERLGTFDTMIRSLEDAELQRSFGDRVLRPLIQRCAMLVLRYTPSSTVDSYRRKLILAGSQNGAEVRDFLGVKGLLALGLGGGWLLLGGAARIGPSPISIAVVLAILGFYLPNFLLSRRIKRRQNEIQRALPDTLDLLTICVEAGLGFDAAIGRVVEKRQDELGRECGRVLTEMRMGRARRDALRTLAERTDVADVNTFVSAIVQSEQLGVSISKVLLTQADQMRVRRRQRAEELAHKAPIKMLFPMVFLIFPAIFVVILGPAIPAIFKGLS
jgi:tight adherence protein C